MSRTTKISRARIAYEAAKAYNKAWNRDRYVEGDALYPSLDLKMSGRRSGNNRTWYRDLKLERRKLDRLRGKDETRALITEI